VNSAPSMCTNCKCFKLGNKIHVGNLISQLSYAITEFQKCTQVQSILGIYITASILIIVQSQKSHYS
jgi:hypothetical protein